MGLHATSASMPSDARLSMLDSMLVDEGMASWTTLTLLYLQRLLGNRTPRSNADPQLCSGLEYHVQPKTCMRSSWSLILSHVQHPGRQTGVAFRLRPMHYAQVCFCALCVTPDYVRGPQRRLEVGGAWGIIIGGWKRWVWEETGVGGREVVCIVALYSNRGR
jgi:hypothetical protein